MKVSHGGVMGSISTWHVTLKHRCAGAQGHWTSMPRTIQNSMRQSISASPPMSMDLHTPTRSDYDYTVRSVLENQLLVYIHNWRDILLTGDVQGSDLTHQYPNTKQQHFFHIFYTICCVEIELWVAMQRCQLLWFGVFFYPYLSLTTYHFQWDAVALTFYSIVLS